MKGAAEHLARLAALALLATWQAGCSRPREPAPVPAKARAIERFATGPGGSNSYLISRQGEALLVDAGAEAGAILEHVRRQGLSVRFIVLTHAHRDHLASAARLRRELGAQLLVHEADAAMLQANAALLPDRTLRGGERLSFGGEEAQILHTPGHTGGSVCLRVRGAVFTGDTLFRATIGRTDFPGSDPSLIVPAIRDRLLVLGDDEVVYPGHGESSTIGFERANNPFLR